MKRLVLLSLVFVASCGDLSLAGKPLSQLIKEDPQKVRSMSEQQFCAYLLGSEHTRNWSPADKKLAYKELRSRGFSKRDADLISEKGVFYGTRMSFRGLKCSNGGYVDVVNKAFYPYSGHQWQVDLGDYQFVYLEGNGTDSGMKVTAWN